MQLPQWHMSLMQAMDSSKVTAEREQLFNNALVEAEEFHQLDHYPEQSVLLSRGVFEYELGNFGPAEKDFRSALRLAKEALALLWTERLHPNERVGYLPAYPDVKDERNGKLHDLANIHTWLIKIDLQRNDNVSAQARIEAALRAIEPNLSREIVLTISLYELQAKVFYGLNRADEAVEWIEKAKKLKLMLEYD